uniref:Uncharacterized protein n=1 Tax=Anguilla anguilla TaxID=7936 RepID=A0A0E9R540_ANGAN
MLCSSGKKWKFHLLQNLF